MDRRAAYLLGLDAEFWAEILLRERAIAFSRAGFWRQALKSTSWQSGAAR